MAGYSGGGNGDANSMGGLGFIGAGMIKATSSPRQQQSQESLRCFSMMSDLSGQDNKRGGGDHQSSVRNNRVIGTLTA